MAKTAEEMAKECLMKMMNIAPGDLQAAHYCIHRYIESYATQALEEQRKRHVRELQKYKEVYANVCTYCEMALEAAAQAIERDGGEG